MNWEDEGPSSWRLVSSSTHEVLDRVRCDPCSRTYFVQSTGREYTTKVDAQRSAEIKHDTAFRPRR